MSEPRRSRRRVLSSAEAAEGIGAELFAICQDITADGKLDQGEIQSLTTWLAENEQATVELPAVAFLVDTAKRILADGRITDAERRELHRAVEAVMPKAARDVAADARREAAEAQRPEWRLDFMTAGSRHYSGEAERVRQGDELELLRDPSNWNDRNAIVVARLGGGQIGHVPRDEAALVAASLDRGAMYRARCKKVIGYRYAIPVVVASIFRPGVAIEGARATREAGTVVLSPGRIHRPSAGRALLVIAIAVVAMVATCGVFAR